jgi:hypothetical protein
MALKKIKCIGFSVTSYGSPPYPLVLNQRLNDAGFEAEVSYHATGGLSIDSLPYLLSGFVKQGEADLVIFEITTSWFSLVHSNLNSAIKFVHALTSYCESIGVKIIFLNLYRKNIDDRDVVVNAIEQLCAHKYPILDFKKIFRNALDQINDDGTIDGVHLKQEAINKIADLLSNYIVNNYLDLKVHASSQNSQDPLKLITPLELKQFNHFRFENRHGISLDAFKVPCNTTIKLELNKKTNLTGVFFLYGPDTNQLNLIFDNNKINVPMRDEMSFYRRLGYKHFGTIATESLIIEHPLDHIDVQLNKKSDLSTYDYCNYIIGFSELIK